MPLADSELDAPTDGYDTDGWQPRRTLSDPNVDLPPCLERRSDGAIVVRGHRVALSSILECLDQEKQISLPRLKTIFPTISADVLADVLAFCFRHAVEVRRYHDECEEVALAHRRAHASVPSLEELRRRWNSRHRES
ncbi:MAG: hypothetical protein HYS13_12705 [Planctomycetia bacterium]|nr:hypothetical protein [Planctomycetia bacterium]